MGPSRSARAQPSSRKRKAHEGWGDLARESHAWSKEARPRVAADEPEEMTLRGSKWRDFRAAMAAWGTQPLGT